MNWVPTMSRVSADIASKKNNSYCFEDRSSAPKEGHNRRAGFFYCYCCYSSSISGCPLWPDPHPSSYSFHEPPLVNPYNPCVSPNAATFFTYWNALATQFNFWWQKTVSTMYMCQFPFENELKDYLLSAPSCRSYSHGPLFQQAVYLTPLFERGGLAVIAVGRDEVGLTDFSLRQPAYYFAIIALLTQFRMSANGWSRYNT